MIGATLDDKALLESLAALPAEADRALADAAQTLADRLLALAAGNLSGAVLKTRTGDLRASLRASVSVDNGLLARVTAATPYAAYQEYGFTGIESVRAATRLQAQAFGRSIAPVTVAVRAHQRRVAYPAHAYLRPALATLAPELHAALAAALQEALRP
jgi:phage gpG-like protein